MIIFFCLIILFFISKIEANIKNLNIISLSKESDIIRELFISTGEILKLIKNSFNIIHKIFK